MSAFLHFVVIAAFLIARRRLLHVHPVFDIFRRMGISRRDFIRCDPDNTVLIQHRVAHIHVIQDLKGFFVIPSVFDYIRKGEFIFFDGKCKRSGKYKLSAEDLLIRRPGSDYKIPVLFFPLHMIGRCIGNGSMKRQYLSLIGAGIPYCLQAAGRQKTRCKRLQEIRPFRLIVSRRGIAAG